MYLLNVVQEYHHAPGKPPGVCRLWLFRPADPNDTAAVAVLTSLPRDKGPGLAAKFAEVASQVRDAYRLSPHGTLWVSRKVLSAGKELLLQVDLNFNGRFYFDPEFTQTTRAALAILAGAELPPIADDEAPR